MHRLYAGAKKAAGEQISGRFLLCGNPVSF